MTFLWGQFFGTFSNPGDKSCDLRALYLSEGFPPSSIERAPFTMGAGVFCIGAKPLLVVWPLL